MDKYFEILKKEYPELDNNSIKSSIETIIYSLKDLRVIIDG